jgi:hypothetical protein
LLCLLDIRVVRGTTGFDLVTNTLQRSGRSRLELFARQSLELTPCDFPNLRHGRRVLLFAHLEQLCDPGWNDYPGYHLIARGDCCNYKQTTRQEPSTIHWAVDPQAGILVVQLRLT